MSLLSKLLEKRGINKVDDLSPDEREVFDRYALILSEGTVTVDSIRAFCRSQINIIENKFSSRGPSTDDTYLKASLHVYLNLLKAIDAPTAERESLERYLTQLIS